jgi:hypothetical protein
MRLLRYEITSVLSHSTTVFRDYRYSRWRTGVNLLGVLPLHAGHNQSYGSQQEAQADGATCRKFQLLPLLSVTRKPACRQQAYAES